MYYGLFAIYFILCLFFIPRIPYIKKSGIDSKTIQVLFSLKITAGILLGWIVQKYYPLNDYWLFNIYGVDEYNLLLSNPKEFFTNIFYSYYPSNGSFFGSVDSYWNDLETNIIVKVLAFLNIFSQGNYYINSLLLNFIGFFGHIALFRIFNNIYKNKRWQVLVGCFLLPSTLYFVSGINKDLFIFTLLCFYCYGLYTSLRDGFIFHRSLMIFICFIFLLLIRNYVALGLIPATIAWILCKRYQWDRIKTFAGTYIILICLLGIIYWLFPLIDPIKIISAKQKDFLLLTPAATQLATDTLQPNLISLLKNTPQAFNHGFMRPYIWDYPLNLISIMAIELFIFQVLVLCSLIYRDKNHGNAEPFVLFALIFSLSIIILCGFIVPSAGSIVRYRSVFYPFIITPLLCMIKFKRRKRKDILLN